MPTTSVLLCDRCASRPTLPPPTTVGARSIDQAANILRPHASSLLLASLSRFPSSVSLNPSRGHLLPGDRKRTNEHHSTSTNDTHGSGCVVGGRQRQRRAVHRHPVWLFPIANWLPANESTDPAYTMQVEIIVHTV